VRAERRLTLLPLALLGALAVTPPAAAQEPAEPRSTAAEGAPAPVPPQGGGPAKLVPRPDPRLALPIPTLPADHPSPALQPQSVTLRQGLLYGGLVGCVGVGFLLSSGENVQPGERGRAFAVGCALGAPLGMIAGGVLSLAR
jgi:hypothetical protein